MLNENQIQHIERFSWPVLQKFNLINVFQNIQAAELDGSNEDPLVWIEFDLSAISNVKGVTEDIEKFAKALDLKIEKVKIIEQKRKELESESRESGTKKRK